LKQAEKYPYRKKGYASETGTGTGASHNYSGGGAGYGGEGGKGQNTAAGISYGSIIAPVDLGSGGGRATYVGNGGSGGGAVRLIVGGTLTVNGSIAANGGDGIGNVNYSSGGGSGGSIYLTVGGLAGSGTISANGGATSPATYTGGGGAGGRIAMYYDYTTFSGQISAFGGGGYVAGGAGTVYSKDSHSPTGELILSNGGNHGAQTPIVSPVAYDLSVRHGAKAYHTAALSINSLRVMNDGLLTHLPGGSGISVTVASDALVDIGGAISASRKGYASSTGPGTGTSHNFSAGYGGEGGGSNKIGGTAYGSIVAPVDLGSGGGRANYGGDTRLR
jgi:hypothetical protein